MTSKAARKRAAADDYDEGDGFVAGDGSDDQTAPKASKKIKSTKSTGRNAAKSSSDDVAPFWELSDKRRVSIEDFRGKTLISIREFYEKDGELLPGKKVGAEGLSHRLFSSVNHLLIMATGDFSFNASIHRPYLSPPCHRIGPFCSRRIRG